MKVGTKNLAFWKFQKFSMKIDTMKKTTVHFLVMDSHSENWHFNSFYHAKLGLIIKYCHIFFYVMYFKHKTL